MKYLIFGGSGFIGSHLINVLRQNDANCEIYNLDIEENKHQDQAVYVYCDVREKILISISLDINDVIFNLAAIHRTPGHLDYEYFETNIRGAENVTAFAEKYGVKKIVFTSSIAPYGADEGLKDELTLPTPNTPYGTSKLVAEKIHQIWQSKDVNRELTILRPGVVFGKGENGNFTRLYWGIRKHTFFYPGRKNTIKGGIYVKDLVLFMIYKLENHNGGTELYNCTFEPAYNIEDIVEAMSKVTRLKAPKLVINGKYLMFFASIIGAMGGKKMGIHPDRVKKLMVSTNISGKKLSESGYKYKFTLESALKDWFLDNDNMYLK